MRHASEVLADVENEHAWLWLGELGGLERLVNLDRRHHLGNEPVGRGYDELRRFPVGIVVVGGGPTGFLQARVVGFAAVDAVENDWAGGAFPRIVADYGLAAAIGVIHAEVQQQLGRRPPWGLVEIPDRLGVAVEPAVAEDDSHGVGAALESVSDIVGHVKRPSVVARIARVQEVIADFPAVQVKFVVAEATDIGAGLLDPAVKLENPAKEGGRIRVRVRGAGDPFRPPVAGLQEAHFPTGRFALGGAAGLVPDADLPENLLARFERLAGVADLRGVIGHGFAAIPQVGLILLQSGFTAGDQHLIRRLFHRSLIGGENPAQARLRRINAERVIEIVALEAFCAHRGRGGGTKPQQQGAEEGKVASAAEFRQV